MAISNIFYNDQLPHGRMLRVALNGLEQAIEGLADLVEATQGVMPRMIDGSPSDSANYTEMKNRFGFPDNATAKAAYDELNSVFSKINTDASVSSVKTAILQAISKFKLSN